MSYWTIEQVAEYLDTTVERVYESRRRKEFPGNRGSQRGRRLMFPSEAIEEGRRAVEVGEDPDSRETTNDTNTAILWQLQGIQTTLRAIHNELRAQRSMLAPLVTPSGYIVHEDDESLDKIKEAWERGEKGITMNPARGVVIEDNTFTGEEEE